MARTNLFIYKVTHETAGTLRIGAQGPGQAARKAFAQWKKDGRMKRQPPTTKDGGFARTTIEYEKRIDDFLLDLQREQEDLARRQIERAVKPPPRLAD